MKAFMAFPDKNVHTQSWKATNSGQKWDMSAQVQFNLFYQVCNTKESGVVKCVAKKRKYYVLIEPRHNRHYCGHRIHSVGMFCMQHYSK